jgi:hypothetical protein
MTDGLGTKFVVDELDKIVRRVNTLQKTVDILLQDRDILENIQGRLTGLEEQMKLTRQHDNEVRKDIKEEVNTAGERVEKKVDEISEQIDMTDMSKARIPKKKRFLSNLSKALAASLRRRKK